MSRGQIASVLIMAVTCFATFFLSLRNWTLSASAMFVNVLPVAIVAAMLGATGRPIDMATVFIMGISLGIAVDDTSFFVHEYLARARARAWARWRRRSVTPAVDDRDLRRDRDRLQRAAGVGVHADADLWRDDGRRAWCWRCCAISSCSRFSFSRFRGTTNGLHYAEDTVAGADVVPAHSGTGVLKRDATSRRKRRWRSSRSRRSRRRAR